MVRIQVSSPENTLIESSNYKSRTGLVSPFKRVRGYPGKNKKKIYFDNGKNCHLKKEINSLYISNIL